MSPRDSFWFLAGVLVAVAIMATVRAWLSGRSATAERPAITSFAVPIAAGLALVGVALGIYFLLGSPDSIASARSPATATTAAPAHAAQMDQQPAPTAGSLDDVTNKLAMRLAKEGGSDNDWKLLAESYEYMGRTADAQAAKAHIASAGPTTPAGPATAVAGDSPTARPTGDQIADMANAFDKPRAATPGAGSDQPHKITTAGIAGAPNGPANSSGSPAAANNAEISGTVEITAKLAPRATSGATLFIYAKQPNAPGPPLAVLRVRAEHWPVSFTLNDGNAMVPGRNLSNANNVQIEARISKNGDALPKSGDLVGTVTSVNPRDGRPVKISIDREIG